MTTAFLASTLNYAQIYEVRGSLPEHSWWRRAMRAGELYIVAGDWAWSFVLTHEEVCGVGPFFAERLDSE